MFATSKALPPPNHLLHIGDNKQSDVVMAKDCGIDAVHYVKPIDKFLKTDARAAHFKQTHENKLEASILLGCLSIYNLNANPNYWYDFGFRYGGAVVYGYMQWLLSMLQNDDIKEVLFVARDGYSLQKVFDILKNEDIKTHYYYAPRIINLVCNLNHQKNRNIDEKQGFMAVQSILSYFKNKDSFLAKHTPEISNYAQGDEFIQKHRKLYEQLAANEITNYQKYFEQFNITADKVALVDSLSIMLSAQKSLSIGLPDKEIHGYYWHVGNKEKNKQTQYITLSFQQNSQQKFLDWNIMELYMTAPTPPAAKIENGQVVFKEITPQEQKRIEIYPDLSAGIVGYAKFMNKIFGSVNLFTDSSILVDWTNILCKLSTRTDTQKFLDIQHAWDLEHTKYVPLPSPWFIKEKKIKILGITLLQITKRLNKTKVLLFGGIPLIKITNKNGKQKWKFWGIPIAVVNMKG